MLSCETTTRTILGRVLSCKSSTGTTACLVTDSGRCVGCPLVRCLCSRALRSSPSPEPQPDPQGRERSGLEFREPTRNARRAGGIQRMILLCNPDGPIRCRNSCSGRQGPISVENNSCRRDFRVVRLESDNVNSSPDTEVFRDASLKYRIRIAGDLAIPALVTGLGISVEVLINLESAGCDLTDASPNVSDIRVQIQDHEPPCWVSSITDQDFIIQLQNGERVCGFPSPDLAILVGVQQGRHGAIPNGELIASNSSHRSHQGRKRLLRLR